ncbi:expressed unknown protein [Seminavis robusta]|uniref:Uncharacterized protein n=1 Tax=Seminavis robusta TaxID=568900 RepID=A0A9N8E3P4_9STRA|nr:expressed unknown protein [Seminavis robusta]|eukprot:Sro512_g157700.1 n/a (193) ;mRNA; f:46971-47549
MYSRRVSKIARSCSDGDVKVFCQEHKKLDMARYKCPFDGKNHQKRQGIDEAKYIAHARFACTGSINGDSDDNRRGIVNEDSEIHGAPIEEERSHNELEAVAEQTNANDGAADADIEMADSAECFNETAAGNDHGFAGEQLSTGDDSAWDESWSRISDIGDLVLDSPDDPWGGFDGSEAFSFVCVDGASADEK